MKLMLIPLVVILCSCNSSSKVTKTESSPVSYDLVFSSSTLRVSDDELIDKLYKHDGSVISQVSNSSLTGADRIYGLTVKGSEVYFKCRFDESGYKLCRYNGNKTEQVSNINPGSDDDISSWSVFGESILFGAAGIPGDPNYLLYQLNGSQVTKISDQHLLESQYKYSSSTNVNEVSSSKYYFFAKLDNTENDSKNLFVYNGATAVPIEAVTGVSFIDPTDYNGNVIVMGIEVPNSYLYKVVNNTPTLLLDQGGSPITASDIKGVVAGALIFTSPYNDITNLYAFNGSVVTRLPYGSTYADNVFEVKTSATAIYFSSEDIDARRKTFKYDGLSLIQLPETCSDCDDRARGFTEVGGAVYYYSSESVDGYLGFYKYDGTNKTRISSAIPDSLSPESIARFEQFRDQNFSNIIEIDGTIYFTGTDNSGFRKFFKYDGNTASVIRDFNSDGHDFSSRPEMVKARRP